MFSKNKSDSFVKKISNQAFYIFVFVSVFGTSMPFGEEVVIVSDISKSNILNQVIYGTIFVMSFVALLFKKKSLMVIIKKEKYMSVFILWCILSILWSQFSFVSFKRLFQVITAISVSLAYLLHRDTSEESFSCFKSIFFIYIILSIIAIMLIPEAKQFGGMWRGISSHKNQLGQIALISSVFWIYFLRVETSWRKFLAFFLLSGSVILLAGSKSMTSIITFGALVLIALILFIDRRLRVIGIGRSFSILLIIAVLLVAVTVINLAPELIIVLPEYLGKNITFTGRSELWADVLNISKNHIILGYGFGGFWNVNSELMSYLYDKYLFLPKTAHNGYLDLFNQTGIIGFTIILFMVFSYLKELQKINKFHFWVWPLSCVLILNITESTLFVQGMFSGNIFIFSYLSMYNELIFQRKNDHA